MRKGRDGESGGGGEENNGGNSGHYVVASRSPNGDRLQRRRSCQNHKIRNFWGFGHSVGKVSIKLPWPAVFLAFIALKKVSIKLPRSAVFSTQKCVHRTAKVRSSIDTFKNCHLWQEFPSVCCTEMGFNLKHAWILNVTLKMGYVPAF